MTNQNCTEEEKLDDLIGIMLAGTETTAHSLVSCLYFLNKYPEALKKLREELKSEGFTKTDDFINQCTVEKFQSCTYLNSVVKETLRRDTAVSETFDYVSSSDIKICDVPIKKGTKIRIDAVSSHFDERKWLEPESFIPERFDFDSEFYQKSKKMGKVADIYSRRSFSHGNRNCPGQSFALLEMKLVIAYFVTHIDFNYSKEDLSNENIGFGMGSQFVPNITIRKL
uniref:Cytochrome P450 n=1 Tax=Euplotes crassus TaxID=5936 RepID=A0A7S3KQG3_EUPCR|mmetsp:Transcript_39534/g.39102  ORF Transcript_39534/g.39102 Transcript_39534/m.39102 type:complete len:226 (+) Transcript_39534:681-1358(+)